MIANQLARLAGLTASYGTWTDDRWWSHGGSSVSGAGIAVTPETALRVSTFYACLKVLGETILSTPLPIYRRLPNGDRELAHEHPLWAPLNGDDPNDEQTSGEWRETHTVHTAMRGTSYSRIQAGDRGPMTHFEYLHPDCVIVERMPSGVLRYRIRDKYQGLYSEDGIDAFAANYEVVNADEIFRLPGLSADGVTGLSVLRHARESLGVSLALQSYTGNSFRNGGRQSGVLQYPGTFSDEDAANRLRNQWQDTYGGISNAGKTIILENGMTYAGIQMNNNDIQMLGSEQWQVSDIARWFRMPLLMIGEEARTSNWGTGVEQHQIGFIIYTMLPWFIRMETRVNKTLINPLNGRNGEYFCEFNIDGLLRGDVKTRMEAYQIQIQGGWVNRNEVRRKENWNRGPDELDEYLQPLNFGPAGTIPPNRNAETTSAPDSATALADPRLKTYGTILARQIVRKETERMKYLAERFADDGLTWKAEVGNFYEKLASDMVDHGQLPDSAAQSYIAGARERALLGVRDVESWQDGKIEQLLGLMLSAEANA